MRSFTCSDNWNHLLRYRSLQMKSGPRSAFRPRLPNWQLAALSPPAHAPVLGSTVDIKASGLSHWIVPGCVTPAMARWLYSGAPPMTLANCGPPPCTMPLALALYGELNTVKGRPLCQKTVPDTCHPFTHRDLNGSS